MECEFELSFRGRLADRQYIQFYDASHALRGFERAISSTTHLLVNGQVITQSPSAKGFYLLVPPPEAGSWKWKVALGIGSTVGAFGLAPPDTVFGWLAKSAVDYVIQETLGFQPDFEETLGPQIERYRSLEPRVQLPNDLSQSRFDSVIEKCEDGIKAMHRPIVFSATADVATVQWRVGDQAGQFDSAFTPESYQYLAKTVTRDDIEEFIGFVSSYNSNTFNGRLYSTSLNRTIPFSLSHEARTVESVRTITSSLRSNAISRSLREQVGEGDICLRAFRNESANGRLKSLYAVEVLGIGNAI